jgi:hypothetical protein
MTPVVAVVVSETFAISISISVVLPEYSRVVTGGSRKGKFTSQESISATPPLLPDHPRHTFLRMD